MPFYKTDNPSLIPNCLIKLIRFVHVEVDGAMYTVGELISSSTPEAFAWTAVLCCLEKSFWF